MDPRSKNILVIDDEPVSRAIISRMLENLCYTVTGAPDGATGMDIFRTRPPDLVLVDLFMPEMDGFEVLTAIQAQMPETPVIVISATERIGDVIRALRLGAWDFITKPVQDKVFLENTVRRALEKAELTVENRLFRERIQTIVNAVLCGIVVIESESQKIMEVNPLAAEMIGLPSEEIVGRQFSGFIYPVDPEACLESDPTCVRAEKTLLRKDGSRIPIHKTVTEAVIDNRACRIESFVDISEHQKVQQELIGKKRLQGVIEMAGAVCHEMNQPMQVVSGLCELAMMDIETDSPIYPRLETIRNQVTEMGRITRKLMGVTRYETKGHLDDKIIDIDRASDSD